METGQWITDCLTSTLVSFMALCPCAWMEASAAHGQGSGQPHGGSQTQGQLLIQPLRGSTL